MLRLETLKITFFVLLFFALYLYVNVMYTLFAYCTHLLGIHALETVFLVYGFCIFHAFKSRQRLAFILYGNNI